MLLLKQAEESEGLGGSICLGEGTYLAQNKRTKR